MKKICVSIAGLPNSGKSTLINSFCNKKISIISPKPHTTQVNIIASIKYNNKDIIFIDTPGISKTGKKYWAIDASHYLFVIDAHKNLHKSDLAAIESLYKILNENFTESNLTIAFNKIDIIKKEKLLLLINIFKKYTQKIFMISAKKNRGVNDLLQHLSNNSIEKEYFFEETEKNDEFMISEIIREKIFQHTHKEIPYYTKLEIEFLCKKKSEIHCSIIVKKNSHKKIIIGKNGELIKKIRVKSTFDIKNLWNQEVKLFLFIKILKKSNIS